MFLRQEADMPYDSISDAEKKNPGLAKYSDKAKRGWLGSFNSCMKDGDDESKCFAIAYSVANRVDGVKKSAGMIASEILDVARMILGEDGDLSKGSRCREILPPEPFDFKHGSDIPVVFLAGAIDQGSADDWQSEVVELLGDVDCIALNPRRKEWDKSWKQDMDNPKFREQVEWELKGLEQSSLIALCFTKESKAPISLLELGLHASGGKVIVHCPKGYWRKGNVDIVCARHGVPLLEDFEDFKREVHRRMMFPDADGVVRPMKASVMAGAIDQGIRGDDDAVITLFMASSDIAAADRISNSLGIR
jgi:hypothetical protein